MNLLSTKGLALLIFVVVGSLSPVVRSAHSRRRVIVRSSEPRYDRSITTFDPSGQLRQVEYGIAAADRGASVSAVLAHNQTTCYLMIAGDSVHKVHRISGSVWLVTAGLAGDSRALATSLRDFAQKHKMAYGEAATVEQVARETATLQHALTRMGGARPLACIAILVGKQNNHMKLFRTGPGGILEECRYCAAGKQHASIMTAVSEKYDGWVAATPQEVVRSLLGIMEDERLDVWRMQTAANVRGHMETTLFWNARRERSDKIMDRLE